MDVARIQKAIEGKVYEDEETLKEVVTDFGRIVHRTPKALVVPASPQDVQNVVKIAAQEDWSVSVRGSAHSQGGQSLSEGGILIDLSSLDRVESIDTESALVQAGVLLRDLVRETHEQGLIPCVLTDSLDVTVGGALSTAGFGAASHRYGTLSAQVEELEVVTGEGHLVRCSPSENEDLFQCSRCGFGQFSITVKARIRLRRSSPSVRTYFLLYDNLDTLMEDQRRILRREHFDYVESWCAPCSQGMRKLGDVKIPFAEWFYPMHVSLEYGDDEPSGADHLADLSFYRQVHTEDSTLIEFLSRKDPVFSLWKQTGTWNLSHPWMEALLPWDQAAAYVRGVLKSVPPNLLIGGLVSLWPFRSSSSDSPLLKRPDGDSMIGFGILPAVSRQFLPVSLALLRTASDLCAQIGGKRYLSGWIDFDHAQWKQHYGDTWEKVLQWKTFYDPSGILNPRFIQFSEPEPDMEPDGEIG